MRYSAVVIVGLWAAACGGKGKASTIREADDTQLTDCSFLQKVVGTASDSDTNAEATAQRAAREQAASIGATHIKWIIPCCTSVEAEAYRCDVPDEP